MIPPRKFISLRPNEGFVERRRAKGMTLSELLDLLNKFSENDKINLDKSSCEDKRKRSYQNLSEEDRLAQDCLKKLRGALNKLAPDNFYIQLLEIQDAVPAADYQLMQIFVRQFIDKAINEELYSILYAQVCHALKNIDLIEVEEDSIYNFGTLILDECYGRFCYARSNINWFSLEEPTDEQKQELSVKEDKKRKILVGVVRFLGDLFIAGMLEVKDIFIYIKKLEQDLNEKCIESLCKLLTRAGKELESAIFQIEQFEADWCSTWERIANLSQRESLPLRQKVRLLNLLNLRNNGWESKFPIASPKTSAEILLEEKEEDIVQTMDKNQEMMNELTINSDIISMERSVIEAEKQILHLLKKNEDAHAEIIKWDIENFKGRKTWLIYSLTRAVLRVSIDGNTVNRSSFWNHISLLKRYIMSRQAEVACMYAVQYIVIVEMNNPKGLLEQISELLYSNGIVSYIAFLDWRENWSKSPVLEVKGRAEAHITLANFFIKLFRASIKPSANYTSIVKELNSFDLEHFVSMSKLPPEIGKRIKMEEQREKASLIKNAEESDGNHDDSKYLPLKTL